MKANFTGSALTRKIWLLLPIIAAIVLTGGTSSLAAEWQQSMIYPQAQSMPIMPFLDYIIDETRTLDIDEAAAPELAKTFQPLALEKLPNTEGIAWLRFTLAPLDPDAKPRTFLLDMGQSVPGSPILYSPERNELSGAVEWSESKPSQRNILLLPEAEQEPLTCYIRLDGLPGPWFAPIIRTPHDAASNWSSLSRTGAILSLGIVMLLCLLRGLSENGQWRIWTALFVAVALVQAITGIPAINGGLSIGSLLAILSPGLALMLLPHVGRHLLAARDRSRSIDIQLLLLSLPGAAFALLPLLPGWSWLDRWLDLWPAGTLIFVPTALAAWLMGIGGARRFLLGCLMPPLFTTVAFFGLDFGLPANFLASLPIWGAALSALLIAATRAPTAAQEPEQAKEASPKPEKGLPFVQPGSKQEIINLNNPLDDPNLRLIAPESAEEPEPSMRIMEAMPENDLHPEDSRQGSGNAPGATAFENRENALREPLDELLREGAALGECSLPPASRQYAEKMIAAAQKMADIISGQRLSADTPATGEISGSRVGENSGIFNLQRVMRNAHDSVAPAAEHSGTALSWYMPPHMSQIYRGDPSRLEEVLRLLLESAVRACRHGNVNLGARRVPESIDAGHILFTITDSGRGYPPKCRSSLALAKAWELAGEYDGYLGMESGPSGTTIAFSLHFLSVEDEEETDMAPLPHIIVACDNSEKRLELVKILEDLPCRFSEAASMREVIVCQRTDPATLLVARGNLARPSAADMAHEFTSLARKAGFDQSCVLAVTGDDSQWPLLKPSGFTHAMLEPVDPDTLINTVSELVAKAAADNNGHEPLGENDGHPLDDAAIFSDIYGQKKEIPPQKTIRHTKTAEKPEPAWLERKITVENSPGPLSDQANDEIISVAPDMQIDQDFPISQTFEGPEWLNNSRPAQNKAKCVQADDSATAESASVSPEPAPVSLKPDAPKPEGIAPAASMNLAPKQPQSLIAAKADASIDPGASPVRVQPQAAENDNYPDEWVGEPMPIGTPISGPASPAPRPASPKTASPGLASRSVASPNRGDYVSPSMGSADEWVGEPMPVGASRNAAGKADAAGAKTPAAPKTEAEKPLMDFIVGVERNKAKPEPGVPTNPAGGTPAAAKTAESKITSKSRNATVKDFVSSSVSLVTSTLASMLANAGQEEKNKEQPGSPKAEPAKNAAPSAGDNKAMADPAIVELVNNLDLAIANAAKEFSNKNGAGVAVATRQIATESEKFGLRQLARMAQCVERAAKANDFNALRDLLPELAIAVERNRIALSPKK